LLNIGGCKNIALPLPDQTISLYDFDFSVIDDKPVTAKIKMRMDAIGMYIYIIHMITIFNTFKFTN